jgi:hypothetical protein
MSDVEPANSRFFRPSDHARGKTRDVRALDSSHSFSESSIIDYFGKSDHFVSCIGAVMMIQTQMRPQRTGRQR